MRQAFTIEHERGTKMKAEELQRIIRNEHTGILKEGKLRVKELDMSPHAIANMSKGG